MQASGSLPAVQRESLELTFTCLKGITAFLESIEDKFDPDEKFRAKTLGDLADVTARNLISAFPDLLEWLKAWKVGQCARNIACNSVRKSA
jgi:hypothetical protein